MNRFRGRLDRLERSRQRALDARINALCDRIAAMADAGDEQADEVMKLSLDDPDGEAFWPAYHALLERMGEHF